MDKIGVKSEQAQKPNSFYVNSKMKLGKERDVTLLRIIVSGKKKGKLTTYISEMVDFYDPEKGYTSMGKTTSFPASIAAQMIVSDFSIFHLDFIC